MRIPFGQFFGCAAPTKPISMGATAPKKSAPMDAGQNRRMRTEETDELYLMPLDGQSLVARVRSG